jgi:perosamine synthetase
MIRPIAISLSPNAQKDDIVLALKTLINPGSWNRESEVRLLEKEFAARFGDEYRAIAVNSGRSAEYLIIKSLGIGKGDYVAIQAFTCVVAANSIIWTGARPLYIDIDDSFNIKPADLIRKSTSRIKAIIVQHTFGIPADLASIKKIADKWQVPIIEDCAHSLGGSLNNKKLGTIGNISFFSFGRDKIISSIFGGMILCKNEAIYQRLKKEINALPKPSFFWIFQQLVHPILFFLILPFYNLQIGKAIIFILQKFQILSKAVYGIEKEGKRPKIFPMKMPGGLAILARKQMGKLEEFNDHRTKIANLYFSELNNTNLTLPSKRKSTWLRFPIRCKDALGLFNYAKTRGVLLGDWYKKVIFPVDHLSSVFYKEKTCPNAEKISKTVINLPTYPNLSIEDAKCVISLIKQWLNT